MEDSPLLEQLDWFFTSNNWISHYPNSMVLALAKTGSDNVPCVVIIDTLIPKARLFRFENYWVDMPGFKECVADSWTNDSRKLSSANILTDKLKNLRFYLKRWQVSLSCLKLLIQNFNKVIL
jgi:hypothetical protein